MPELENAFNPSNPVRSKLGPLYGLSAIVLLGAIACTQSITDESPGGAAAGPGGGPPGSSGAGNTPGSNPNQGGGSGTSLGGTSNGNGGNSPGKSGGAGNLGGSSATAGTGGSVTSAPPTTPPPVGGELSNCTTPGPRLVRRLTSVQFRNTLVAVFNDPAVPSTDIFADPFKMHFHVDADIPVVRDLDAGLIMDYAETVADWAVKNNKVNGLATCTTLTEQNCRQQFIKGAGLKLGREPVSAERLAFYEGLYNATDTKTFQDFQTDVLTAMLESPYFIYRRELGTSDAGAYKLTAHEVASELSYFLTDGPPDDDLLKAAADNRLNTAADIDTQAARLLMKPEARRALAQFVGGWLEIEGVKTKTKDPNIFMLTDALRASMIRETEETFFDAFDNGGDVGKLLTTKRTFLNQTLGQFYGLPGGSGDAFAPADLSGSMRPPGILGQAAFLVQHAQPENSSPLQRGLAIRDRFLCEPIPAVPKDLNTTLAPPGSFTTNRQRFEQHSKDPICNACHKPFDPIGFAFENFDGFGRYRTQEVDKQGVSHPIDATGTIYGMPEGDIPLNGPQPLVDYLATSDTVRACLVRYWSYYAHGRDNWTEKKCNDDAVRRESATKGNSLKSVLMGILHAPSFTRRVKEQ